MTIKDIFNSAINFDLTNIVYFVGGIILLVMPIGMVWLGAMLMIRAIIEAYIQMNIKVKQVKNMSIIDFCKVVIISNSDKI